MKLSTLLPLLLLCSTAHTAYTPKGSFHNDFRNTPRLEFDLGFKTKKKLSPEQTAWAYLGQNHRRYQLPQGLENLKLIDARDSLLGTHFRYQQHIKNHEIISAEIIVSVSHKDNSVYQVFNNTYPVTSHVRFDRRRLESSTALDLVWKDLKVTGRLLGAPRTTLAIYPKNKSLNLVYITDVFVDGPYGDWRYYIDATSGKVLKKVNRLLPRTKRALPQPLASRPRIDRQTAYKDFLRREALRVERLIGERASGTGIVFDPDPRTTLMDSSLKDTSAANLFDNAYFTRPLNDITKSGNTYRLSGAYVQITDFDSPSTAPSTSSSGNWTAKRGDNSFNDVMTYYHLDKSQRYLQSLGFTGSKSIQAVSIEADSDGASGADNSFFSPTHNRLSFGHGCVDDNEDADVILHEYGHAIQHGINPNWNGGDTGAIGEGFGDYWAGSYSLSTPNGAQYFKNEVFSWDAHGDDSECWNGRVLNALATRYDPTKNYTAHSSIPGGFQSDELWSTPLFQALLAAINAGYTREDVDTIVLESHFGLGEGVTMREMANATISAANRLYPGKNHAQILVEKFLHHEQIVVPHASFELLKTVLFDDGNNGIADPGETVQWDIHLVNDGTLGAKNISATLESATAGVTIVQGYSNYDDMNPGDEVVNDAQFSISIDSSFPCGNPIDLKLKVSFNDGAAKTVTLLIPTFVTGAPQGLAATQNTPLAIPDNDENGIESILNVSGTNATVTGNFNVTLDLSHTYVGDLDIVLKSPSGKSVKLHDRSGGGDDDIVGNYPATLAPAEDLAGLLGESVDGPWTLSLVDNANLDTGTLNEWSLQDITGYLCQ